MQNLPKLLEDIVQTSINTGPRGALRLAQGIQAVIGVGSEWVADASKVVLSDYLLIFFLIICFLVFDAIQIYPVN